MPSAVDGGLVSRYNESYFCTITSVDIREDTVVVEFVVRGDESLGPLQRPEHSRLVSAGGIPLKLKESKIVADDAVEISGSLAYDRVAECSAPFMFAYGEGGYSIVELLQFGVRDDSLEEASGDEEMGEAR